MGETLALDVNDAAAAALIDRYVGLGHVTYAVENLGKYDAVDAENGEPVEDRQPAPLAESNVISSRIGGTSRHRIMLDLDIPATLIPSSTPGHSHLYIETAPIRWPDYHRLLEALAACGVIEHGYAGASIDREATMLRLPWIRKETPDDETA
jgi:hypothetical protein